MEVVKRQGIIPLDPNNSATWRNVPCPINLEQIQGEINKVGGLNPFGEPNFKIFWGQEYKEWDNGSMRIRFNEGLIPAIHTPNRYAVRPEIYRQLSEWLTKSHAERQAAFMRCDWAGMNDFPDIGKYLEKHALSADYTKMPSGESDMAVLASLLPDGWVFISGLWTHEFIGQQCFYVAQWLPTSEEEESWNGNRYGRSYLQETDRDEDLVDIIGKYPAKGYYPNIIMRISTPETIEVGHRHLVGQVEEVEIQRYKEPNVQLIKDYINELLRIRERLSDAEKSPQAQTKRRFDEHFQQEAEISKEHSERIQTIFRNAAPVGAGNPTNISANKNKIR